MYTCSMTKKQKVLIVISALAGVAVVAGVIVLVTVLLPARQQTSAPAETGGPAQQKPQAAVDQDGFRVYPREARYEQFKPPTVLPPNFTKWVRSAGFDENDSIPVLKTVGDLKVAERGPAKTDPTFGVTVAYRDSKERKVWLMIRADSHPWDVEIADLREVRTVGPALCGLLPPPNTLDCFLMTADADVHLSFGSESSKDIYNDEEIIATFQTILDAYRKLSDAQ